MTKKMRSVHYLAVSALFCLHRCFFSYSCPHQFLVEWDFRLGCCHLREEGRKGFDEVEESDCDTLILLTAKSYQCTHGHS